jgi:hypothetical protein
MTDDIGDIGPPQFFTTGKFLIARARTRTRRFAAPRARSASTIATKSCWGAAREPRCGR